MIKKDFTSWGNLFNRHTSQFYKFKKKIKKNSLPYGNGKSYGDCCITDDNFIDTVNLNKILSFDKKRGIICCQSGVSLEQIHSLIIPKGWMLAVTPGCELITVGGAIANDVHGKNFNKFGSFCHHVKSITLVDGKNNAIKCSHIKNQKLFLSTCGGIGATGLILDATIKLKRIKSLYLETKHSVFNNIQEFIDLSIHFETKYEHIVAWLDCIKKPGRGVLFGSRESKDKYLPKNYKIKKKINFPKIPFSIVNNLTVKVFNTLYFWKYKLFKNETKKPFNKILYPLDSISNWNRIYGRKGFYQVQFLCHEDDFINTMEHFFFLLKKFNIGSFLTVLKIFKNFDSIGYLSFAEKNTITLAIDLPNKNSTTCFLKEIESLVMTNNGKFYLAKDAFMSDVSFKKSYKNYILYKKFIDKNFYSKMIRRLFT